MTAVTTSTAATTSPPRLPSAAKATALVWFALAALAGASGVLLRLPFPVPQVTILGLVVATFVSASAISSLRAWIESLPLRALVGINGLRFIGIVFLVLAARGQLAQVFADRAGWGDIAIAALALLLVASSSPTTSRGRAVLHAWNVFGFLDLVVAVGTATAVTLQGLRPGMEPLFSFPLSVVPLFFVPIFLVNHIVIFRRLVTASGSPRGR